MRPQLQWFAISVGLFLVSGFASGLVSGPQAEEQPDPSPLSTGSSPKVHIIEGQTGTWCTWCGPFDPAINRVIEESSDLVFIAYHGPSSSGDPFYDPAVFDLRAGSEPGSFYHSPYYPTTIIDGGGTLGDNSGSADSPLFLIGSQNTLPNVPGPEDIPLNYNWLRDGLAAADTTSNIAVSLTGDLTPVDVTVTVTITATDPVPQTNLAVRTLIYETSLYYPQTSGPPVHVNVARALNEQPLAITQGQTVTKTATFLLNPGWTMNSLGAVAFVQSDTKRPLRFPSDGNQYYGSDILNAAGADFSPRGILIHRDRGTVADYSEVYETLLTSRADYTYETWNTYAAGDMGAVDDRGLPSAAEIAEFPLVIWHTGPTSSAVLSSEDRTLIGGHLDAAGSLLITGSDIGFDAWPMTTGYRAWYQQYLHAEFNGDDTLDLTVAGIAGDPISDAFSGLNLNVLADGDRINAVAQAGSAVPFQYSPGLPGSVRSQHDADSRLLYLGFQYFEGTDSWREGVMGKIIEWVDGTSGPTVDVLYPDGGEQFAQGAPIVIRWHANDVLMTGDSIDLYFSDNGGMNWQPIAMNEPNDGRYAWTVPNIDSAQCRVRVVARDLSVESADGEAQSGSDFICGDPGFRITFTGADLGWRLISFPTILADTTTPAVLSSMAGSYRMVRAFNPTSADPWQAFDPTRVGSDLAYIDNTMAFWIEITAPGTFDVQGQKPTTTQYVTMRAGWNLVGFPSYKTDYTVAMLMADTGATRVETFDASNIEYRLRVMADTEFVRMGSGFWVYVPADTVWMVPAA